MALQFLIPVYGIPTMPKEEGQAEQQQIPQS
jgi:hypothetical protein